MKGDVLLLSKPLDTRDADDGTGDLILDNCLGFRVGDEEYWIPKGARTDLASRPALSRPFVRWNKDKAASAIHDYPFEHGFIYNRDGTKRKVTLWEMNRVYRKIAQYSNHPVGGWFKRTWMAKDRSNPAQAWLSWTGLLAGSWWPWRKRPRNIIYTTYPPITNPLNCDF